MVDRDYMMAKLDEVWEMIHHDIDGLRNYAKEADAAFSRIRALEDSLRDKTGKIHGPLKHWEEELNEIFKIAQDFKRS